MCVQKGRQAMKPTSHFPPFYRFGRAVNWLKSVLLEIAYNTTMGCTQYNKPSLLIDGESPRI